MLSHLLDSFATFLWGAHIAPRAAHFLFASVLICEKLARFWRVEGQQNLSFW